MIPSALLFVHLACFAAYVGAGFAQTQFVKRSLAEGLSAAMRSEYESLAAAIVTKIELPAIMGSLLSGLGFLALTPALMKQGWLHGKLTVVLLLLVLSHVEMFNARKIVKARAAGGSEEDIVARKKRHGVYGGIGALLVVALLFLVTFVRLGAFR